MELMFMFCLFVYGRLCYIKYFILTLLQMKDDHFEEIRQVSEKYEIHINDIEKVCFIIL